MEFINFEWTKDSNQNKRFDVTVVDIDAITEEECQLAMDEQLMSRIKYRLWKRNHSNFAVLTFSAPELPIGSKFSSLQTGLWIVFAMGKAFGYVRFDSDEYGHEATTKLKYRRWAESHGIIFGE